MTYAQRSPCLKGEIMELQDSAKYGSAVIKALPGEKNLLEVIVTRTRLLLKRSEGRLSKKSLYKASLSEDFRFCDVQANKYFCQGYFYYEV
jgi:hypothetical protein